MKLAEKGAQLVHDLWSREMLFTTAMRGSKNRNRAVALVHFAEEYARPRRRARWQTASLASMKFFMSAPFMIVGPFPARCRIHPIMPTVVDLPLVPATPTLSAERLKSSREKPRARDDGGADTMRGLYVGDRLLNGGGGDKDLIGSPDAAAILRMQQHAARPQEIKSLGIAPLIERAVGTLDPPAPGLDDQRQGVMPLPPMPQKK